MISLKLALRELKNHPRFSLFFALNLAVGFSGLLMIESFRDAVEKAVAVQSRTLLSADLAISARRDLSPAEKETAATLLPPGTRRHEIVEIFSMAASGGRSKLAQLRAVENGYPFHADIRLERLGRAGPEAFEALASNPAIFVDRSLGRELELGVGDSLRLGETTFRVADWIERDSTNAFTGLLLAPRIYLHTRWLPDTGLLQPGSLRTSTLLVSLPKGTDGEALAKSLDAALADPAIRVRTHQTSTDRSSRLFSITHGYLGLVSLTALFLASLGVVFQFRRFLLSRLKSTGILLALGATRGTAHRVFIWELLLLGSAASLLAVGGVVAAFPLFADLLRPFLPESAALEFSARSAVTLAPMALVGALLLCTPQLHLFRKLQPSALFREDREELGKIPFPWRAYVPSLFFFATLAFWLARSWKTAGIFLGTLAVAGLFLVAGTHLLLKLISSWPRPLPLPIHLALRHLFRNRTATRLSGVTVGLAALLISLVPQLQFGLKGEFETGQGARPGLFLFDIQDDQVGPLSAFASERGLPLRQISPMVRARLTSVNRDAFEKNLEDESFRTREEERASSMRNRGFNLSYRKELSASEKIVRGRPFSLSGKREPGAPAQLSVEERFAKRLGWKIGDRLEFDVQGIPIQGEIVNLRSVRWMSFEPNFFVLFEPGFLEETPKTYLAVTPPLSETAKADFQTDLAGRFSNVSSVDTQEVVARLLGLAEQMAAALRIMSVFTLLAGLFTLWAMIRFDVYQRRWEINLLKILGGRRRDIAAMMLAEVAGLAMIASLLGVSASVGVNAVLLTFVFDAAPSFDLTSIAEVVAGVVLLSALLSWSASFAIWREHPQKLLSAV